MLVKARISPKKKLLCVYPRESIPPPKGMTSKYHNFWKTEYLIVCPWKDDLRKAPAPSFVQKFENFLSTDTTFLTDYQKTFYNTNNYIDPEEFKISSNDHKIEVNPVRNINEVIDEHRSFNNNNEEKMRILNESRNKYSNLENFFTNLKPVISASNFKPNFNQKQKEFIEKV